MAGRITKNTSTTITVFGVAISLIVLTVVGCVKGRKAPPPKTLTIALQKFVGYGPFFLGQEKGFFKDEGLDLIFVDEQLESARRDAFRQGMLDCEATTFDVLIKMRASGVAAASVMEVDQSSGVDGVVAVREIKALEDLIGKRVALARGDTGETFLSVLFYDRGLPFDKLIIVPSEPGEVAKAFLEGMADAAVTWEPQVSECLKRPGSHILVTSKDTPGIIIDVLNVRDDIIRGHPDLVKGLMRGWFRAVDYYNAHPEKASDIIAKYYHMTGAQYRQAVKGLDWTDYKSQPGVDAGTGARLTRLFNIISDIKFASGEISQKPDERGSIKSSLLKGLYENSR